MSMKLRVPREKKMLKRHLPRVILYQVYWHTGTHTTHDRECEAKWGGLVACQNADFTQLCNSSEADSYFRFVGSRITQRNAQHPVTRVEKRTCAERTCDKSKEAEKEKNTGGTAMFMKSADTTASAKPSEQEGRDVGAKYAAITRRARVAALASFGVVLGCRGSSSPEPPRSVDVGRNDVVRQHNTVYKDIRRVTCFK